jgi:cyclophilin family peptidyl-prolyl cis-trans isomerase/HEAT repeat protein
MLHIRTRAGRVRPATPYLTLVSSPHMRAAVFQAAAVLVSVLATRSLSPQPVALEAGDSALVRRVLMAEDRRTATDPSLATALAHADPRVRALAARALARIGDPRFAARDSLALAVEVPTPRVWPESAWRLRFRALAAEREDCHALAQALADADWRVRLRAADLLGPACANTPTVRPTLQAWVDALPADVTRRARTGVSWHAAAHGLVALARVAPTVARPYVERLADHSSPWLRAYVLRAAAQLEDTARVRRFARDADPNVRTEAVDALRRLAGHADDALYAALVAEDTAPQVVRVAANALAGTPQPALAQRAAAAFDSRWSKRPIDSERDVRQALLRAGGRDTAAEASLRQPRTLPATAWARAAELALGADVRLRVTMHEASGGGSFTVRLRGDVAPIMAARVVELVEEGYYNGLTWHRVEHDFVLQGGSPGANEYVGHDTFLRDELGTVPHVRGTVGMSTRGHDTGDAQWFVNLRDNLRLGRDYTLFAEVVEGMDVVDDVLEGDVIAQLVVVR